MFWLSPIGPERRPGFEYSDYRKEVFALGQCNPLDCRKWLIILRSSASSVRACSSPPSRLIVLHVVLAHGVVRAT